MNARQLAFLVGVISIGILQPGARAQAPAARPSFDAALEAATPVGDLEERLAPLFDDCKSDDEVQARQCRTVRDWVLAQMSGESFVALGDEAALQWEPYDPAEKKLTLDVEGCLACGRPLEISGQSVFVTSRVPKGIRAGRAIGLDLGFHDVAEPDAKTAAKWRHDMTDRLEVQFVFQLGPVWKSGAFRGVTFVPVAHRIFDRCTGEVVAIDPPMPPGQAAARATPMRDERCPETDEARRAREEAALPEQLTPRQINEALAQVRDRVLDCAREFQASGTAIVHLELDGSGKLERARVMPPLERTAAGYCIHAAIAGASFPRFRGQAMVLDVPLPLP